MPLFQKTIIAKYLKTQNKEKVSQQYAIYKNHFLNISIQQNIKASKEEEYQEGFLEDLFVKILGYTKKPQPNFNLESEKKNLTDSKKADGAILINEQTIAVIELKSTHTIDLSKVEYQAFGYKNSHKNCTYVIVSNFEKLRFFIDDKTEFIEFNLFQLSEKEFEELYLCLAFENIKNNVAKQIKEASITQEKDITERLYKDYTNFKNAVFQDFLAQETPYNALVLFKKTQKLLDRFLFVFFAEDRHLLPVNSIRSINQQWKNFKGWNEYRPLYKHYQTYFGFIRTGLKNEIHDIFAFNGGLFDPDEVLDNITIDDKILLEHSQRLSDYDFNSEIDVNILGHIFENSLNEIDEIKAQLENQSGENPLEKNQTKRKKDGVFYTPRYITQYIILNTVGKLCAEKKEELKIYELEYQNIDAKTTSKKEKQQFIEKLTAYRDWLLQITILDPACGSGAFLNEALNFLIDEHEYIDTLQSKVYGDSFMLTDVETSILENNLFGVDLNEESVEIAKLSLWLRTARPNRKLTNLNNNIKCGNSLIDDPVIAGEKAFNWQEEFPHIFSSLRGTKQSGFDVVVGNPPYGVNFNEEQKKYLINFDELVPDFEIYIYFISLNKKLLKNNGLLSYIFPNTFLSTIFGKKYREFTFNNLEVYQIIDLSNDNTFVDAAVRTCIFSLKKSNNEYQTDLVKLIDKEFKKIITYDKFEIINETDNILGLFNQTKSEKVIILKLLNNRKLTESLEVSQGLIPYDKYRGHDEFTIKNRIWHSDFKKDETYKKELKGGDINRYTIEWNGNLWISYGSWLAAPRDIKYFTRDRILIREITTDKLFCCFSNEEYYNTPSLINIINEKNILDLKYTLAVLNSKLIGWYHNKVSPKANKGLFPKILINDIRNIPLVEIPLSAQTPFIEKADLMLTLHQELQEKAQKFQRNIKREFNLEELPKKLQEWYLLPYQEFLKELEKKKVKLTLAQKSEWDTYFMQEANETLAIKTKIDHTDKEIDRMVYKLYGLSDEEIAVVEMG